jgi:hypothetical protein
MNCIKTVNCLLCFITEEYLMTYVRIRNNPKIDTEEVGENLKQEKAGCSCILE